MGKTQGMETLLTMSLAPHRSPLIPHETHGLHRKKTPKHNDAKKSSSLAVANVSKPFGRGASSIRPSIEGIVSTTNDSIRFQTNEKLSLISLLNGPPKGEKSKEEKSKDEKSAFSSGGFSATVPRRLGDEGSHTFEEHCDETPLSDMANAPDGLR